MFHRVTFLPSSARHPPFLAAPTAYLSVANANAAG